MFHDMHYPLNMDGDYVLDNPMSSHVNINEEPNKDAKKFYNLLKGVEQKLYLGCQNFYRLSFIIHLLQIKCLYGWSNISFDSLLKLLACINDCILYRGGYENLDECPICKKSRWQENKKKNIVPNKIVSYFPIKPRLQRLFMSKQVAKDMKWHKNKRVDDGVLRHPIDSWTWKSFDDQHMFFASDACNVILGLSLDGFNPFDIMSNN